MKYTLKGFLIVKNYNIEQLRIDEIENKDKYFSIIESLLFVTGESLRVKDISEIIECDLKYTKELLNKMISNYEYDDRGIKLICINDSYQLATKPSNSSYIQKLLKTNTRQSLSQASLEALAIIAYKQPVTRIDIDEIRGVKSDRAITSLQEKNLVKECGRLEAPGRPILYGTTEEFLRYFNLSDLDELPSIENFVESFKSIDEDDEI